MNVEQEAERLRIKAQALIHQETLRTKSEAQAIANSVFGLEWDVHVVENANRAPKSEVLVRRYNGQH